MFGAYFFVIDDATILSLSAGETPVTLLEGAGRFRPGYLVLRGIEAAILGTSPFLWHADRIALAVVAALAGYVTLVCFLAPWIAALLVLPLFVGPQAEAWMQLLQQEAYGVALSLVGFALLSVRISRGRKSARDLAPGYVCLALVGLVKESFIPLLPVTMAFLHVLILPRPTKKDYPWLGAFAFVTLVECGLTLWQLIEHKHIHATGASLSGLVTAATTSLSWYTRKTLWFLPALVVFFFLTSAERRKLVLFLAAGVVGLLLPQWIVYGPDMRACRYLTPGNFFVVYAMAVALYLFKTAPEARGFVLGVVALVLFRGAYHTYQAAEVSADSSHRFQQNLEQIVTLKKANPDLPLVFCATSVWHYEPVYGYATFLRLKLGLSELPILRLDRSKMEDGDPTVRMVRALLESRAERHPSFTKDDGTVKDEAIGVVFGTSDTCKFRHTLSLSSQFI